MREIDEKALQAKDKKAGLGPDIDLETFSVEAVAHEYLEDLARLPEEARKEMRAPDIDTLSTACII